MTMPECLEKVIGSILGVPAETLLDDSSSNNIQEWDSLRQLSILLALESAYGISINTNEAMDINSIANIKAVLKRHGVEF
jgi:acyl carrier protein